jgi:sporulation protein YqfC
MDKKYNIRKKSSEISEQVADILDMPKEVMLNIPKISCIGKKLLTIENHRGIIKYSLQKIRVSVSVGEIEITGENLRVKNIFTEELEIEGSITNISFK